MKKSKKGVSPVIATVLLIAMVVVLSLIVFLWMRGLAKETVTKFGDKNIERVCEDIEFSASYSNGKLFISNIGNVPIFSLKIKIESPGGYETPSIKDLSDNWPDVGLNQGQVFSGNISVVGAEKLTIIPILIGTSDEGKKVHVCDEGSYGYKINLA